MISDDSLRDLVHRAIGGRTGTWTSKTIAESIAKPKSMLDKIEEVRAQHSYITGSLVNDALVYGVGRCILRFEDGEFKLEILPPPG